VTAEQITLRDATYYQEHMIEFIFDKEAILIIFISPCIYSHHVMEPYAWFYLFIYLLLLLLYCIGVYFSLVNRIVAIPGSEGKSEIY